MASPYLEYDKLVALAFDGGYTTSPALSQLSAVFLLSGCLVLRMQWLWQNPIAPIDDNEYQDILSMIEQAEAELMIAVDIGTIVPSVTDLSAFDRYLLLDGALVAQGDYPELTGVVPASWLVGPDIQLPNMQEKSLHGEDGANIGDIVGTNDVTLTVAQMPSHTHVQDAHSHGYATVTATPTAAGLEPAFASLVTPSAGTTSPATATNQNTGGGESHTNVPESLAVSWWIVAR